MPRLSAVLLLFLLLFGGMLRAQTKPRYGIEADPKSYPQANAREALKSVLEAIKANRFDYLVAHLADPAFVDARIKRVYDGKFDEQVSDTRARLDPATVKQLKRFLDEGKWTIDKTTATVQIEEIKDRCVRLTRQGDSWYLEHRFEPTP